MQVQDLNLSKRLSDLLHTAGLDTVEQVQQAGRDGLIAIDGIGPASADDILAAVAQARAAQDADTAQPAPPAPAQRPHPTARVTVRNASDGPVLVNGRYLYPGDMRLIRRHQIKPGLVEV